MLKIFWFEFRDGSELTGIPLSSDNSLIAFNDLCRQKKQKQ